MICERYWQDGVLHVERDEHDPHRDTCIDCRRAHAARDELIRALPRVGAAHSGDPSWQMRVWSRIAREEAARARRSYWLGGGLVAACGIAAVWLLVVRAGGVHLGDGSSPVAAIGGDRPKIEIVSGRQPMRSTSAKVGDRAQISVPLGGEVRIYRADRLLLRCPAGQRSTGCTPDAEGLVADAELATAGEYQLVVISQRTAEPVGSLDADLAAVVAAGGVYKTTDLSVR
jgi:hypothetical protein